MENNIVRFDMFGYSNIAFKNVDTNIVVHNKPLELFKIVKNLTGEDYMEIVIDEHINYKLVNPERFDVIYGITDIIFKNDCRYFNNKYSGDLYYTCLCSCEDCTYLVLIEYNFNGITERFFVGSECFRRFGGESSEKIYFHKNAKRCKNIKCNKPLCYKEGCVISKNTTKKLDGECIDCFEDKIRIEREKEEKIWKEYNKKLRIEREKQEQIEKECIEKLRIEREKQLQIEQEQEEILEIWNSNKKIINKFKKFEWKGYNNVVVFKNKKIRKYYNIFNNKWETFIDFIEFLKII